MSDSPSSVLRVYFAGRFSRLPELLDHKHALEAAGAEAGAPIIVTSRWLLGGHEWVGVADEQIPLDEAARFAREDLDDLDAADVLVCFTEPPRTGPARGGRHVEAGYALHARKPILVVGHVENVFYALPLVIRFTAWAEAEDWLLARAAVVTARPTEVPA